jgi:hypothetical protein
VPPKAAGVPEGLVLAVGTPLGEEPEGWKDLRDAPFEFHLLPRSSDGSPPGSLELALELRPGGKVITDFDGTRAMPFVLYRDGTRNFEAVPVTYGSGATGTAVSPYKGWESALPLWIRPPRGETVLREVVLEIDLVRLIEWKDAEVSIDTDGVLDPVPSPLKKRMVAAPTRLWLSNPGFRNRDSAATAPSYSFDPLMDLWQGRDAKGRRIACVGRSLTGGTDDSEFAVYGKDDEPIAYPVSMRFRTPIRWSSRTYRFVLRDVPLPR